MKQNINFSNSSFLSRITNKDVSSKSLERNYQKKLNMMKKESNSPQNKQIVNEQAMSNFQNPPKVTNSPNKMKQQLRFNQYVTQQKQSSSDSNMSQQLFHFQNQQFSQEYQQIPTYSTKDNSRFVQNNISSVSSISNIDLKNNKLQGHKPPLIPSLKGKMFQASLTGNGLNYNTKGNYNQFSSETGLTRCGDETQNNKYYQMPSFIEGNTQKSCFQSFSILNIPTSACFNQTSIRKNYYQEELIIPKDVQQILTYRMYQEELAKEFIDIQKPYLFLQVSQNNNQNNSKKRIIYSTLQELDKNISEVNLQKKCRQDLQYKSFQDWKKDQSQMNMKQRMRSY